MSINKIFIGYDDKEAIAYHTCCNSIIRQSTKPITITPLALNNLNNYHETHKDGSNKFIYSRFLVPFLCNYKGWALFIDGDMILLDDISKLFDLKDNSKAVMVVKHNYKTKMPIKYLGAKNEDYPRKNWSSVILWNCEHPANQVINPEFIQLANGAQLHRFTWLNNNLIGELPIEWNWLPDELGENKNAKLLHYTLGAPCFINFAETPMADQWHKEKILTEYCLQHKL
jgi:lipopolysaccharide biosynthesis glycosyltransferase